MNNLSGQKADGHFHKSPLVQQIIWMPTICQVLFKVFSSKSFVKVRSVLMVGNLYIKFQQVPISTLQSYSTQATFKELWRIQNHKIAISNIPWCYIVKNKQIKQPTRAVLIPSFLLTLSHQVESLVCWHLLHFY